MSKLSRFAQSVRGNQSTVQHQYAYDKASNVTQRANYVNVTSIDYGPGALNRVHDLKINLPTAATMPYGTPANRVWFTREVYGYDEMSRLTSITRDEEPNLRDQFEMEKWGRVLNIQDSKLRTQLFFYRTNPTHLTAGFPAGMVAAIAALQPVIQPCASAG